MREIKLFINNEWMDVSSGKNVNSLNPADGSIVARVHLPSTQDIDHALTAAHTCFNSQNWKESTLTSRGKILENISEKLNFEKTNSLKPK